MDNRKLAEKLSEKINLKMRESSNKVTSSNSLSQQQVSIETLEKILERNPHLTMSSEARKIQSVLNGTRDAKIKSNIVRNAALKHLEQQEKKGHLIKNDDNKYVMTDDYQYFGVKEVDNFLSKICHCTK